MDSKPRLPTPQDPVPPPRRLLHAAVALWVAAALLFLLTVWIPPLGRLAAGAWLLSLPANAALLVAYWAVRRRRLRRYERRAGFLPRTRRIALPASGRRRLFRVEYGQRAGRICLILTRWDYDLSNGWRRSAVVDHAWCDADDAVALGTERARLTALAEQLEEEADDVRLGYDVRRALTDERLDEVRAERERNERLARQLARGL